MSVLAIGSADPAAPGIVARVLRTVLRFTVGDGERPPFGLASLRGLTLKRFAMVCGLLAVTSAFMFGFKFNYDFRWGLASVGVQGTNMIMASVPMVLAVTAVYNRTRTLSARRRAWLLGLAVTAGALAYAFAAFGLVVSYRVFWLGVPFTRGIVIALTTEGIVFGSLVVAMLFYVDREGEARRQLAEIHTARIDLERQNAEAELQLLQAQIEPHFLFNALASVKRLYQVEPAQGARLLADLADYLRRALPQGRCSQATLAGEVALSLAYLSVFRVRMGERLAFGVDVPRDLERALLPPMMLGTLVENAVKHGVSPRASGGRVEIFARREGGRLVVGVSDDGVGFRASSGAGVGLANTRERLRSLFGEAGELLLSARPAGGVTSILALPLREAAEDVQ